MKVRDVRPILLSAPVERPVRTSFGAMERRWTLLVEVLTDEGVRGVGEVWCNFPPWAPTEKVRLIEALRPSLLGEDPAAAADLWRRLRAKVEVLGLQWGAPGPVHHVLSGLDTALWDAAARAAGLPLYRYLGGAPRASVPVYASGLGPDRPEELAARHRALGVTAFKLKVGFSRELDLRNARATRAAIGPEARLMLDANQAWSAGEAVGMCLRLAEHGVSWIEEPVRCDDLEGMARVRRETRLPLAAGENLYGVASVRRALEMGALDILQPDVSKTGGISESRSAVRVASEQGCLWTPHYLGGAVGLAASLHLAAALDVPLPLELDANPNPLRESLLAEPLRVEQGALLLPEGAGLGVSLDPEAVRRHRVEP